MTFSDRLLSAPLFLTCARRANQDVVATIKRQLQLLLPGVSIFLDVDDLESIDALESYVQASQAMLVLLGSSQYFTSRNCQRELAEAQRLSLPLVRVHDADAAKNGAPLSSLRTAASRRLQRQDTTRLFDVGAAQQPIIIPWLRIGHFQQVSLASIAEQVLLASPACVDVASVPLALKGGLAWAEPTFAQPVALFVSQLNPAATEPAHELASALAEVGVSASLDAATHWLLFVSPECFEGEQGQQLEAQVQGATAAGRRLVLAWSPEACDDFKHVIEATPHALVSAGLYETLAIEWRGGVHRRVSVQLAAKALGAQMTASSGGTCAGACQPSLCVRALASCVRGGVSSGAATLGALRERWSRQRVVSQGPLALTDGVSAQGHELTSVP